MRWSTIASFVAPLGAALFLYGCTSAREDTATTQTQSITVQAVLVRPSPWEQLYEAAGTVRSGQRAALASKVEGTILSFTVKLGDSVRSGQTLVELESEGLNAELARAEAGQAAALQMVGQAQSSLAVAEAEAQLATLTLQRYQELFGKRSVSRQELDQVEARHKAAQANVEIARKGIEAARARQEESVAAVTAARIRKDYSRISAPFAGFVVEKNVDAGTLAVPGMPLLTIEAADNYQLEISLPESHMGAVKIGSAVEVHIPAIQFASTAHVVEIEPAAQPGSRSSLVRIRLPSNPGLRSGLFGRAKVPLGTVNRLAIPARAVLRQGQLQSVFVVSEGHARRRLVTVGQQNGESVEILSGLTDGEQVVLSDPSSLSDGSPVEIRP